MTHDQIILVGGTGSIGIATAELLAARGAHVAITGRNLETLLAVAQRVPNLRTYQCEITDEANVREVFSNFTHIDHVVVLAGSSGGGSVIDTPVAALRFVVEERIWGAVYALQAAVPKMRNGSITLTSGLFSGRPPQHGAAILVAALAGVEGLARALARELAPIRVNAINFGLVRSTRHRGLGNQQDAYYERVGSSLPRGRVGEAHEAAHAITFAVTNEYLTGEVLHVDGGGRFVWQLAGYIVVFDVLVTARREVAGNKLSEQVGQPVIVDTRPGASGVIGVEIAKNAPPDGSTLLLAGLTAFALLPALKPRLPYDPDKDFVALSRVASVVNVVAVHQSLGVGTVADLVKLAKARPGQLTYGSSGNGSLQHLAGEMFNVLAGVKTVHVP